MRDRNYENTPSFYNSQEVFEHYLGQTSYYKTLQQCVLKLCRLTNLKRILELGSATGSTSFVLAKANSDVNIVGIDMRPDIVNIAKELAKKSDIKNVEFIAEDFCSFDNFEAFDFIVMLYSFHHIVDPEKNKFNFLKKVYTQAKEGTYLCIAETFLPDEKNYKSKRIRQLWDVRAKEGEYSTFWESLDGVDENSIKRSLEIGRFCGKYESIAGDEVIKRETEFLLTTGKLCDMAKKCGWKLIINKACNTIGENIVLLKK